MEYEMDDDYWWPLWEGKYTLMNEKSKVKQPQPPYSNKFLPPKFLSDKNKEAFVWLNNSVFMRYI